MLSNFPLKINQLIMAEVDPQHLKAKGQDIHQTKKYCITSKKSPQFIHLFLRYRRV